MTGLENSFGQCCFTSTEIVKTIRDRGPRTSTSSFTPFVSSDCLESVLFFLSLSLFFFLNPDSLLPPSASPTTPTQLQSLSSSVHRRRYAWDTRPEFCGQFEVFFGGSRVSLLLTQTFLLFLVNPASSPPPPFPTQTPGPTFSPEKVMCLVLTGGQRFVTSLGVCSYPPRLFRLRQRQT